MRSFSLAVTLLSVPLLLLLWIPVIRALGAPDSAYRDWGAPLGLALLMTTIILLALRLVHRRTNNQGHQH